MKYAQTIGGTAAAIFVLSSSVLAQQSQFGTAQEARSMLDRAVIAVKADKAAALASVNSGQGGFKDRDLYPFCFNLSDGKFVAGLKQLLGTDARSLKDASGKVFGPELYAAAQKPEGQISEVSYLWPRPGGEQAPVAKVTFVTRAGDLGCGVGYYK